MSDLTAWLLERIAEDEAKAREAGGEWWREAEVPGPSLRRRPNDPTHWIVDSPAALVSYEVTSPEKAAHIARWDPARVLAECAAKRAIVRDTQAAAEAARSIRDTFADRDDARARIERGNYDALARAWQDALRLLAQPYADRPGWREEWAL